LQNARPVAFPLRLGATRMVLKNSPIIITLGKDVKGYKCRNTKTKREKRIKDLPIREIPCTLPEDEQNYLMI
jgi:hypothetical protein